MGLRTFTFAGTSSSAYSMFITEAATYNVPERAVEMLDVPGRNGAYALDLGRFKNVEVTYHVVVHKDTNANFQTELSDVRNWLASKVGYQRLTDDYNSGVYRMAIFKGGLETSEAFVTGAEFDITFECKPQRWLTSGETAVTVADGGTLDNPTPFEAEPLLAVDGYGTIGFNGYEVEIGNVPIGDIVLYGSGSSNSILLDESNLNVGDIITVSPKHIRWYVHAAAANTSISYHGAASVAISDTNSDFSTEYSSYSSLGKGKAHFYFNTIYPTISIECGTNSSVTNTVSGHFNIQAYPSTGAVVTFSVTQTILYDATTQKITYTISNATVSVSNSFGTVSINKGTMSYNGIVGYSTKSAVTDTVYIDCDIGECWTVQGGEIVSLNGVISLGSDLPKLASGTNTFAYDNTVTELNVTPRWWKV